MVPYHAMTGYTMPLLAELAMLRWVSAVSLADRSCSPGWCFKEAREYEDIKKHGPVKK